MNFEELYHEMYPETESREGRDTQLVIYALKLFKGHSFFHTGQKTCSLLSLRVKYSIPLRTLSVREIQGPVQYKQ